MLIYLGKCHIPSGKRRMAAGAARMVAMESTIQEAVVQPEPPRFGHVTMGAVLACASTLVLFAVVFLILQVLLLSIVSGMLL